MLDGMLASIIVLAIIAARHGVFKPFMRNLFSKKVMRNHYAKRGKLWRIIVSKKKLFLRIAIAKLKRQREEALSKKKSVYQ